MTTHPQAQPIADAKIRLAPIVLAAALATSFVFGAAATTLLGAGNQPGLQGRTIGGRGGSIWIVRPDGTGERLLVDASYDLDMGDVDW